MRDNGNKIRPVRTLTVKNFSVIKDAVTVPLEFGKITVLIGPQASGKSLLCRLAYFFQKAMFDLAAQHIVAILDDRAWDRFVGETFQNRFCEFFPPNSWGSGSFRIEYSDGKYNPIVSRTAAPVEGIVYNQKRDLKLTFASTEFKTKFDQIRASLKEAVKDVSASQRGAKAKENIYRVTPDLQNLQEDPNFSVHSYVPGARSIFSTYNPSFATVRIESEDPVVIDFSRQIDYEYRKLYPPKAKLDYIDFVDRESRKILGGEVVFEESSDFPGFREKDGRQLRLTELSSGTRELLPLLTHISKYAFDEASSLAIEGRKSPDGPMPLPPERVIYVEEPEANVFPTTQYDLVRLFAWMAKEKRVNLSWVITTHSPYILSAFNNLIEASQVAASKPDQRADVAKLIPEQYWVKSEDFKAYCIHDGNLESIMDSETGLISANYLDSVSETIGIEFDELLRLGYVES